MAGCLSSALLAHGNVPFLCCLKASLELTFELKSLVASDFPAVVSTSIIYKHLFHPHFQIMYCCIWYFDTNAAELFSVMLGDVPGLDFTQFAELALK